MAEPMRVTFMMYRDEAGVPSLYESPRPGTVYDETEETYEERDRLPGSTADLRVIFVGSRQTGRRLRLVDVLTYEEFLRHGDGGYFTVTHPEDGDVYRLREV